jgi:cell division ATPase FtsA
MRDVVIVQYGKRLDGKYGVTGVIGMLASTVQIEMHVANLQAKGITAIVTENHICRLTSS